MNDSSSISRAAAEALMRAASGTTKKLEPHQVPPKDDFYGWVLIGGRGSGKTRACAQYVVNHVNGPPCIPGPVGHWVGIIAPTLADAATSCFQGPSGIRALDPGSQLAGPEDVIRSLERYIADATNFPTERLTRNDVHRNTTRLAAAAGGLSIKWPNGSEAKMFGTSSPEDVERLRAGSNRCLVWAEEVAAWRHLDDCYDHMRFGLRQGPRPHWIGSTTPKPRPLIRKFMLGEVPNVIMTHATMYDNPHLPESIKQALEEAYGGLSIGRQELYAELIDESEGALFTRAVIDENRVRPGSEPVMDRISVGVDPSGGRGEQGIVVIGKVTHNEIVNGKMKRIIDGYVLDDRTCHKNPEGWGKAAVQAAVDWEANDIVVEVNFGGDMAVSVIKGAADAMGVPIPVRKVTASRGKRVRAEPVAAMASRGLVHHVGNFADLEDQMCVWNEDAGYSPDRMDAAVWPFWHMKMVGVALSSTGSFPSHMGSLRIVR